ncbi:MAG: LamG-like jellyroll fold domain-containing protein [Chthoniobacteraceae bacterium]
MRNFTILRITLLLSTLGALAGRADTASDVRDFTGAPMRMVWIQDAGPTACVYSEKPTIRLMGFDTEDGKGERAILPQIGWYAKPLLTQDGKRVVFANLADHSIDVVNFDGTGLRQVLKNDDAYKVAERPFLDDAVWTDPKSGVTWVYAMATAQRGGQTIPTIRRFQLDHPEVSELIWDKTPVFMFMVSGDGRMASGGPVDGGATGQGVFTLPNGTFLTQHNGCWPSMSPDASHRMWVFSGNHKAILLFTPTGPAGHASMTPISFTPVPGLDLVGYVETYHPRWSNNVRFLSMDAEYPNKKWMWTSDTKIPNDVAEKVQIYLGRFKDDFSGIERWIQVTHSKGGNYWSNVWIKPSQADLDALTAATKSPQEKGNVAPSQKGLVYTWLNGGAGNQIADPVTGAIRQCNGQLNGEARYARGYAMDLTGGFFAPDAAAGPLLAACKASNQFSLEADITPTGVPVTNEKVIMAFADDLTNANFVLAQQGNQLVLGLKTDGAGSSPQPIPIASLIQNQPNHIIISYADGRLGCFINGQEAIIPNPFHGGLSNWTAQPLIFGDAAKGGHNWPGLLEDINFFNREISQPEAKQRYLQERAITKVRKPVETVVVDAKLITRGPPADPKGIAPYRRCLSVSLYQVEKIISGTCPDSKISVAQWSVLDAKVVPGYDRLAAGQTCRIAMEKMDDHPEQESERTFNGDTDAAAQLYYEVRNPAATPAMEPPTVPGAATTPGIVTITNPTADDLTSKGDVQLAGHGSVVAVAVVNPGADYTQPPQAQFSGGGGQGAAGIVTLGVASFDLTGLGGGYTGEPAVVITPPDVIGGRQATATAQIDKGSGSITGFTVLDPGSGYLQPPGISFTGGGGSGAAATPNMAFGGIIITNGGSGYTSPPTITLTGGGGHDAVAQAALQVKTLRYTDPTRDALFTNSGTLEQDGSSLVFDWAASQAPATNAKTGFSNTGTWILKNGARVCFTSHTGFPDWMQNKPTNSGTLSLLDHSQLGFTVLGNGGVLKLGQGAILGQSEFAAMPNAVYIGGPAGGIDVAGSTPDQPAVFGFIAPNGTGRRDIANGGRITVGSGQDASVFNIVGGIVTINNSAAGQIAIKPGAVLGLITNDNGSTNNNTPREVRIVNGGNVLLEGFLRLQGNGGGFAGIDNHGKLTIQGDRAGIEHMPNSTGAAGWYNAFKASSQILNEAGGVLQGIGTLTYTNSTGNPEGRLMRIYNLGTITPGQPSGGKGVDAYGALTLHNVDVRFGAYTFPPPPPGTPRDAPPLPPVATNPPKPGTLQIGIGGPPTSANQYDTLTLSGTGGVGVLELLKGDGNILNIVTSKGFTPHGTYRIVTATSVAGTFETLQYNGAAQIAYTVKYLRDSIEVVFP